MAILISHRFSTVRMADQIVVLDGGRIVERGSHDSLMAAERPLRAPLSPPGAGLPVSARPPPSAATRRTRYNGCPRVFTTTDEFMKPPALSARPRPAWILLAVAIALTACTEAPPAAGPGQEAAVRVIAEPMRFEPARTRVEAVGTSRALRSVAVHPATSGEVVAVHFQTGQYVAAGDLLVELDSRDEKLAVELGRVRLQDAETLHDRYRRSAETGAVTPTQLDAAATQEEAARIELGRAQVALDDRFIKAPFAGHVDVTDVDPGDRINEDTLVTTLDDRGALLVNFEMPEMLVGQLATGDQVSLVAWNREREQYLTTMATPGKMDSHQAVCRYCRPCDTIRPQLTSGGWIPMPRKLSEDSASMT